MDAIFKYAFIGGNCCLQYPEARTFHVRLTESESNLVCIVYIIYVCETFL